MSETMANAYADDFAKMFRRDAQDEFLDCIRSIYQRSEWKRVASRELRLVALDDEETARSVADKYELRGKPDVIKDTLRNTKLMLRAGEEFIPVRSTALHTILNRAGIGGKTLFSLDKTHFASFINLCLEKVRGDALLRICVDKVSAVLGGDQSDYAILQMDELFARMVKYLDEHYPGYEYQGGSIDHSLTWASWSVTDRSLLDSYRMALSRHALPGDGLTASVRLMTSDVGASSVVLYPILRANHRIIPLGTGLALEHKHQHNLEMFDEMVENLFAGYQNTTENLAKLLDIEIMNPRTTMLGVMKHIRMPKKLAYETAGLYEKQCGAGPCSAHDLYYALSEAIFTLQCRGANGTALVRMEELVSKALKVRWTDFDYNGEFKW